ncbi:nucleotidyltransferase domain-containing protein [Cohnella silvisoli]|uniref:nucleotidyltransferase domain-containing protein n=1 Tax=Cohnella silvisoli TaxID=2873699 RepID=UPI0035A07BBC
MRRITLRTDINNWVTLTVPEICTVFSEIPVTWCIAGGWALDLYVGKQSRKHDDVDVIILREEQLTAFQYLSKDWTLYKTENGTLAHWKKENFLPLQMIYGSVKIATPHGPFK